MFLCKYGCGQEAKYGFPRNPRCAPNHKSCPTRKGIWTGGVNAGLAQVKCKFCEENWSLSYIKQHTKQCEKYKSGPPQCKQCKSVLDFEDRSKKFCNSSCSASYSNSRRTHSAETKRKIGAYCSTKEWKDRLSEAGRSGKQLPKWYKISFIECIICKKFTTVRGWYTTYRQKTCSRNCALEATCRTRSTKFDNPWQGTVTLGSPFEVEIAEFLTARGVKWFRPKPVSWKDSNGKKHLYYPDFFLPEVRTYLDPKNPRVLEKDRAKLEAVSKHISVIAGSVQNIKIWITDNTNSRLWAGTSLVPRSI